MLPSKLLLIIKKFRYLSIVIIFFTSSVMAMSGDIDLLGAIQGGKIAGQTMNIGNAINQGIEESNRLYQQAIQNQIALQQLQQMQQAAQAPRYCCRICSVGYACGNSCISRYKICHKPPGCACNLY